MSKDEALRLAKEALIAMIAYALRLHADEDTSVSIAKSKRALAAIDEALGTPPSHTPKASE